MPGREHSSGPFFTYFAEMIAFRRINEEKLP